MRVTNYDLRVRAGKSLTHRLCWSEIVVSDKPMISLSAGEMGRALIHIQGLSFVIIIRLYRDGRHPQLLAARSEAAQTMASCFPFLAAFVDLGRFGQKVRRVSIV